MPGPMPASVYEHHSASNAITHTMDKCGKNHEFFEGSSLEHGPSKPGVPRSSRGGRANLARFQRFRPCWQRPSFSLAG